jgi:hypothetical protein
MLRHNSTGLSGFLASLLIGSIAVVIAPSPGSAQFEVREVQPTIKYGGRVVAVDVLWREPLRSSDTVLAASESGGVFRSTDGGESWAHVPFRTGSRPTYPHRLNNLRAYPTSPFHAVLTAPADWRNLTIGGRQVSGGGIWITRDGGRTWEKPPTAEPPAPCGGRASAWGIAIEPATATAADKIYVGTDCGLAVSLDGGATWAHQQVNGRTEAVYSVIARDGIVDVCSATNHFRLDTRTGTWSGGNLPGTCWQNFPRALAVSPLDRNVIFASFNMGGCKQVYESDDGGSTWYSLNAPALCGGGRESFVGVAPRPNASGRFDLYYGNGVRSYRVVGCGAATRTARSCAADAWQDLWALGLAHDDHMDVAFSRALASPNCASFIASDAGVYRSTDCGASWAMSGSGMHGFNALQIYDVYTQVYDGFTHVYIGTQDNDLRASPDGGATWPEESYVCCEGGWFALQHRVTDSETQLIVGAGVGWGFVAATASNFQSSVLLRDARPWVNPDPATTDDQPNGKAWGQPTFLERNTYLQWSEPGKMWLTTDPTAPWTPVFTLPAAAGAPSGTGWLTTGPARDPTLYIPVDTTASDLTDGNVRLLRVTNVRGGTPTFTAADTCRDAAGTLSTCLSIAVHIRGAGTFVWKRLVAADPRRPNRLMAVDWNDRVVKTSRDGGVHWDRDDALTNLVLGVNPVTGRSEFAFDRGDANRSSFITAIAFDLAVDNRIFVGTEANCVFMSTDDGASWIKVPDSERIPIVTSFDFDEARGIIYVASYGRGLWSLKVPAPVRPDRLDRLEENNQFSTATVLGASVLTHTHISPADAATNPGFRGSTSEIWRWSVDRLTLHDWQDRDYFRLRLPDPTREQVGAHAGFPDCAIFERMPPVPGLGSAQLVITGELSVTITGGPAGESVRVFPVEGGSIRRDRELPATIPCPWTDGLRELAIAFGERDDTASRARTDFREYSISVVYRIDLRYLVRPSMLATNLAAAKELSRLRTLYCRNGFFPHCFGQDSLHLTAPGRAFTIPDCRADGPGCPMFYTLLWPETHMPLSIEFEADQAAQVRLVDADGKALAEARMMSKQEKGSRFLLQAGKLKPGFYALEIAKAGPALVMTVPRARWRADPKWYPAKRQPSQSFDGEWEVNATALQGCAIKNWKSRLTIKGMQIFEDGSVRGQVAADGTFQYVRPAPANPKIFGPFTGKLQGVTGTGTYSFVPPCNGSITLKKM